MAVDGELPRGGNLATHVTGRVEFPDPVERRLFELERRVDAALGRRQGVAVDEKVPFGLHLGPSLDEVGDLLGDGTEASQLQEGLGVGPHEESDQADEGERGHDDEQDETRADGDSSQQTATARARRIDGSGVRLVVPFWLRKTHDLQSAPVRSS